MTNYREALRLNPNEFDIYLGLGDLFERMGQLDQAVDHFQVAVKLKPERADAHAALARSLAAVGKNDEAERHYQSLHKYMH